MRTFSTVEAATVWAQSGLTESYRPLRIVPGDFAQSPFDSGSEWTCRVAQAEKCRPRALAGQQARAVSRLGRVECHCRYVRITWRQHLIERGLRSSDLATFCVNHPRLRMVRSLGRLLGVAPDPHADRHRLTANRGRLGGKAPFRKAVLVASGLVGRAAFAFHRNSADHSDSQGQSTADELRSPNRQPSHGSEA